MSSVANEAIDRLTNIEKEVEAWVTVCQTASDTLKRFHKFRPISMDTAEGLFCFAPARATFVQIVDGKTIQVFPTNEEELKKYSNLLIQGVATAVAPVVIDNAVLISRKRS